MKRMLVTLFERQPFYASEDLWNMFSDVPRFVMVDLLRSIINNKTFQVRYGDKSGYIRYCNGYYVFQPNVYMDLTLPLAIRVGRFPVKRDAYLPLEYEVAEVEEEEKEVQPLSRLEELWDAIQEWAMQLATEEEYPALPDVVEQHRIRISEGDKARLTSYLQNVEMIEWFHTAFHTSPKQEGDAEAFRRAILFYFWDEWMSLDTQLRMVYSSTMSQHPSVMECIREGEYSLGRLLVRRFYQPKNHTVFYACEEGKECSRAIVDSIQRDDNDRLRTFAVTPATTGALYGFVISKNGELVFKTNQPHYDGRVEKGQECGNVSGKALHLSKLLDIGAILEQTGRGDYDLNRMVLMTDSPRSIRGTNRICTLMNLLLRYLHELRIQRRAWFFRPLFAYTTGHPGFFRYGKK